VKNNYREEKTTTEEQNNSATVIERGHTNNNDDDDQEFLQRRVRELERKDKDRDGMLSLLRARIETYERENVKLKREGQQMLLNGSLSGAGSDLHNNNNNNNMNSIGGGGGGGMTSYGNTSAAHHLAAAEIRDMKKEVEKLRNLLGFKDEELQEAQDREENARRRSRREKQELMNEIHILREQVKKKENEQSSLQINETKKRRTSGSARDFNEDGDGKRRKQQATMEDNNGLPSVSVSDAIRRFNTTNLNNNAAHASSNNNNNNNNNNKRQQQQDQQQQQQLDRLKESGYATTISTMQTTTTMTTTNLPKTVFKDISDWRPILPKAPRGLFDNSLARTSKHSLLNQRMTTTKAMNLSKSQTKFAFFLDSFAKQDALLFLGFYQAEKVVVSRRHQKNSISNNRKKNGRKPSTTTSGAEDGWEYHSAAIGQALASVFLDNGAIPPTIGRSDNNSINDVFNNAHLFVTLLEALKSVAAFDGDKELNPSKSDFADDNARDELTASAAKLLLVLLKNDHACCRRSIEARRRNLIKNLSSNQQAIEKDDDDDDDDDIIIVGKEVAATTMAASVSDKKMIMRRRINGDEFDVTSACASSFGVGSIVQHPLSSTGRVFVHTKKVMPPLASKDSQNLPSSKLAGSSKKDENRSSKSATAILDEKCDAVAIIMDCLRRCIGARAWEATAPLIDALAWLTSFAASEFISGRCIVASRVLPPSDLVVQLATQRVVPTNNNRTNNNINVNEGEEDIAKTTTATNVSQTTSTCWFNLCLKPIAPQETRMACLTLIRTLSTSKSFQDALNDYLVLNDVVSVLKNEIPSASTNALDVASTFEENAQYAYYMLSHSRELVDLALRVLAAFANLDWKGWPRVVRKENILAAAANTAIWEMAIHKIAKKKKKKKSISSYSSSYTSYYSQKENLTEKRIKYSLIMIAHILSSNETQESAMRMLAENANLSRVIYRSAREAVELSNEQASEQNTQTLNKIGVFVSKCVQKVARLIAQ
jgi:hypothetical protein